MLHPLRQLLPNTESRDLPQNSPQNNPRETVRKRKLIQLACTRCRSRKTKCDGVRPACGICRKRSTECEYDHDPDTTPHANLRRKYQHLAEQLKDTTELLEMLRGRPEEEAAVILRRLRTSSNLRTTLVFIKEGDMLVDLQSPDPHQKTLSSHRHPVLRRNSC